MKPLFIILALLLFSPSAQADESLRNCVSNHNQCVQNCFEQKEDNSPAACVAQCAGVEAQCAGKVGISNSEPFIRKKAEQLEKLLDDFFGDILPLPKKEAPAEKPTDT
ncbi:exported hypothetical protein [Candidatus Terasakiella magnetica]|uniref:Uncharacterized protein n=2 Tax=Candidatus Terasakiella magnetica TaxID=1867952 RepID=A0A1C3RM07_9PROT|nr:exported hypothetical protein [Candidatus Terasakiella magnetica]